MLIKKQAAVEKLCRQEARGNEKLLKQYSTVITEEQKAVVDYEYQLGTQHINYKMYALKCYAVYCNELQ